MFVDPTVTVDVAAVEWRTTEFGWIRHEADLSTLVARANERKAIKEVQSPSSRTWAMAIASECVIVSNDDRTCMRSARAAAPP